METPQEEIARLKAENMLLKRQLLLEPHRDALLNAITANTNAIATWATLLPRPGMFPPPFPVVFLRSLYLKSSI
jgi:hypothetical protein